MKRVVAWGRLLRLSLAPTAIADIVAGALFAAPHAPPLAPWIALAAGSACVYHGGMALNDWADRDEDARNGRARPVPNGHVAAKAALAVAIALLVAGPALALVADTRAGMTLSAVALLAVVYDLAGRGAWSGPTLLGACRAGNLLAGAWLGWAASDGLPGGHPPPLALFLAPALYAAYVFCVGAVGRFEDAPEGTPLRPRAWILGACAAIVLAPWVPRPSTELAQLGSRLSISADGGVAWMRLAASALALAAVIAPLKLALQTPAWTRALVLRSMGMLLRRLLVFTAALTLAGGTREHLVGAALILAGYPLSFALRRVFPPS